MKPHSIPLNCPKSSISFEVSSPDYQNPRVINYDSMSSITREDINPEYEIM